MESNRSPLDTCKKSNNKNVHTETSNRLHIDGYNFNFMAMREAKADVPRVSEVVSSSTSKS